MHGVDAPQALLDLTAKLTKPQSDADGLPALIVSYAQLGQDTKGCLTVNIAHATLNAATNASNSKNTRPLRAKLSADDYAWFNARGLGSAGKRRRFRKALLLHVLRHRIKPGVEGTRALVTREQLSVILATFHDYPKDAGQRTQRRWVVQAIKELEALKGMVTSMKTYILLDHLNRDHGTDEQIDAHHALAAKNNARNKAAYAARERTRVSGPSAADALKQPSHPSNQKVESEVYIPLTPPEGDLYNASTPTPVPEQPKQASGFAPSGPKRADAVSANRAAKPQPAKPLASIWPQSGKTLAQPSMATTPYRSSWSNASFDPRSNPKAQRIYGTQPLDEPFVAMLKTVHPELVGLNYHALKRRGANNDTLMAACHLLTRSIQVKRPVGWVMVMETRLRQGKTRYA